MINNERERRGHTINHASNCTEFPAERRILIIQENGRHERNREFRECFCLKRAFNQLGFGCDIWGKGHEMCLTE